MHRKLLISVGTQGDVARRVEPLIDAGRRVKMRRDATYKGIKL